MNRLEIVLGSDHAGFELKEAIKNYLKKQGFKTIDVGCDSTDSCDYPVYGQLVAKTSLEKDCYGVCVCGSGIGISMAANKVRGARCANCDNVKQAELSRKHNDANIIAFGARLVSEAKVLKILGVFLNTPFDGATRHQKRVNQLNKL